MNEDKIHKHASPCSCAGTCSVLLVTEYEKWSEDPEAWFVEVYERVRPQGNWRDRVRVAWDVLRSREPYVHGVSLDPKEVHALRDFLTARTVDATGTVKVPPVGHARNSSVRVHADWGPEAA